MIRVGLIGAGFIGRNHFNQYEKLSDRCRVTALCDKEATRRAGDWSHVGGNVGDKQGRKIDLHGITPYVNWQDLVTDPNVDLVDICCPTPLHKEIVLATFQAGKHVLCEKPMALTVAECDEMLAAAERASGQFMIAQCVRFWPEYVYLRTVFTESRFGALKALHLRRHAETPSYSLSHWIVDPKLSGGAIMDFHIHDVDYVLHLLGKPDAVSAQGSLGSNGSIDRVHSAWHYDSACVVQIEGYWDMQSGFGFNMGFTVVFEQASIVWDMRTGVPLTVYRHGQEPETPELPPIGDGYFGEIDYFLGCIERGSRPTICTPRESRDAVAIALAEKESVLTHQQVTIAG